MPLFENVKYFFAPSCPAELRLPQSAILNANGATATDLASATHIITNTIDFEGKQDVKEEDIAIVTGAWVDRSVLFGKLQPTQFYSPDPSMLFSGIVACATDLSPSDLEVLSAGITALGGQWRPGLTREVTHLFAVVPGSEKYNTAMHYQADTKVKVLVPHWFDDSVRLGVRGLPTATYEWPDPQILKAGKGPDGPNESGEGRTQNKIPGDKKAMYRTALMSVAQEGQIGRAVQRDVWQGRRILLSSDLELSEGRKQAVAAGIARAGGAMLDASAEDEESMIDEADVLISRYRWGALYIKAVKADKLVGTLTWLFHVESTGTVSSPTSQLLHYPIPKKPIENFAKHEITVTNYTGESREYLKKLITLMGATFTPSMSGKNTVVIAAYMSGTKTSKARNWSIPVVNHTWLEDCFVQWKDVSVGLDKYISFPPSVDFAEILGERGIGPAIIQDTLWEWDTAQEAAHKGTDQETSPSKHRTAVEAAASTGTGVSAVEAKEVEEAVTIEEDLAPMDIDNETGAAPDEGMAVDAEPHGAKQTKDAAEDDEDDDDDVPVGVDSPTVSRLDRKGKGRATVYRSLTKRSARVVSADKSGVESARKALADMDVDADEPGPSKPPSRASKRLRRAATPEHPSDTEEPETPKRARVNGRASPPAQDSPSKDASLTPRRTVSVVLPPLGTAQAIISTPRKKGSKRDAKKVADAGADANEGAAASARRPGRPRQALPEDVSMDLPSETPSTGGRLRRSAASKAEQKLRDVVMPDLVNFQKEMRRGAVRGAGEDETSRSKGKEKEQEKEKEASASRGKERGASNSTGKSKETPAAQGSMSKSRKRPSDDTDEDNADSSQEDRSHKKRKTGVPKGKGTAESDEETVPQKDNRKTGRAAPGHKRQDSKRRTSDVRGQKDPDDDGSRSSATPSLTRPIRFMTTGVQLSDDVLKALTKLGAKATSKPSECTHLIVKRLGRTEKLLSAIAVAPYVVTEKWATASAAAKQFLPPEKYPLVDPENEKRYHFKLKESLDRAKENQGQLYADMVFYVTPKVPIDKKLLKNVVTAHGGQVRTQTPTVRALGGKENHYVISCEDDGSIWRPLAQAGYPIYTQELLLTGALTQELDLDNPAHRVPVT